MKKVENSRRLIALTSELIMEKHHLLKRIIALLNEYFKDERAYSMSLFFWNPKPVTTLSKREPETIFSEIESDSIKLPLDIKFHFELLNKGELISGSKESLIYADKVVYPQFMYCKSVHGLSKKIQKRLSKIFLQIHDESIFLNFFSGITFYKTDWKEKIAKAFLINSVEDFFSGEQYKVLKRKLSLSTQACHFEKKLKI